MQFVNTLIKDSLFFKLKFYFVSSNLIDFVEAELDSIDFAVIRTKYTPLRSPSVFQTTSWNPAGRMQSDITPTFCPDILKTVSSISEFSGNPNLILVEALKGLG